MRNGCPVSVWAAAINAAKIYRYRDNLYCTKAII